MHIENYMITTETPKRLESLESQLNISERELLQAFKDLVSAYQTYKDQLVPSHATGIDDILRAMKSMLEELDGDTQGIKELILKLKLWVEDVLKIRVGGLKH